MNKEKQHLVELLSKIDQKKKELKQLKEEYKTFFSAISKSWREQTNSKYPNLQPCNIGEYVGVDIVYEGRSYNLFIDEYRQELFCMFSYDRKVESTYPLALIRDEKKLYDKLNVLFAEYPAYKSNCYSNQAGFYKVFKREDFEDAFNFFLKIVGDFTT